MEKENYVTYYASSVCVLFSCLLCLFGISLTFRPPLPTHLCYLGPLLQSIPIYHLLRCCFLFPCFLFLFLYLSHFLSLAVNTLLCYLLSLLQLVPEATTASCLHQMSLCRVSLLVLVWQGTNTVLPSISTVNKGNAEVILEVGTFAISQSFASIVGSGRLALQKTDLRVSRAGLRRGNM